MYASLSALDKTCLPTRKGSLQLQYAFGKRVCRGQVEFIEEIDEKRRALDIIMRHYTDSEFNYSDPAVRNVKVWQVRINQMTGKVFGLRANEKP